MITLGNLNVVLQKDSRILLKDFNFTLNKGDKVAIIGEEGNGKSTLLKLIYDVKLIEYYCEFSGNIIKKGIKIGYLEQSLNLDWYNFTINEYFLKDSILEDINLDKYNNLNDISTILAKMHMDPAIVYSCQLMGTLSGGEKIKIQLAKILAMNVDVLLLDEPTNDLDIKTLVWLEYFINSSLIPIIFISHDETLLENTANVIIHIEQLKRKQSPKHTIERISYRDYIQKRLGMIEKQGQIAKKQRAEHQEQMEKFRQTYQKVEFQQNTISRSDPHGAALLKKKMKSLKSQERRYEREKENFFDIPEMEEAIGVNFDEVFIPNRKKILDLEIDNLSSPEKVLVKNIKLNVSGPEHIAIIGANGVGKTTLLKIIYQELKERKDITVGYMLQNYDDLLDIDKTAIDFIKNDSSKEEITKIMTFLGSLKFTPEEMQEKVKDLSGGQKAKILILKLILNKCDVLILDEPTRNLSPLSNPIIRNILSFYKGAIISVSHDRKYIEDVCDTIYQLTSQGLAKCYEIKLKK